MINIKKTKNSICKNNKKNILKIVNYMLLIAMFLTGIFYIVGINDLSIKGLVLHELKDKIYQLKDENNHLELSIMFLQSYENISKRADDLRMVKVDKIDYLIGSEETMARK